MQTFLFKLFNQLIGKYNFFRIWAVMAFWKFLYFHLNKKIKKHESNF